MEKKEFDVFELIRIILKNIRMILAIVLIVSIIAVAYSLLTHEIWRSDTTFYAVGGSSVGMSIDIPGLSGLTSGLMGMDNATDALNFISIMESRSFSEEVINEFDLIKYFKLKDEDPLANMDDALIKLRKVVKIGLGEKTNLISVGVETKDKKLSKDIANFYTKRLDTYNRHQKITKGKRNRAFLEERVNELKADVDSLLVANKIFQEKNKAINLENQSMALIESYSTTVAEKMKSDIELEMALLNYTEDTPIIKQLKAKNNALKGQIKNLESSQKGLKPDYMIDIAKIPNLSVQLAQLRLKLEIAQKLLEYLYPQFEAARIEEMRDMPTIEIVDTPRESGRRVRPKRAMICLISAFAALCLATLIAVIKESIANNQHRLSDVTKSLHKRNDSAL